MMMSKKSDMSSKGAPLRKQEGVCENNPESQSGCAEIDLQADLDWLKEFEDKLHRPLRVLHLGNIAGNAYLNAKFLRSVGVEADVVCNDYTHVMAYPEWEEIELSHGHKDDFNPVFDHRDLRDYTRPDWFVSGSLAACAAQVESRYGPSRLSRARANVLRWTDDSIRRSLMAIVAVPPFRSLRPHAPVIAQLLSSMINSPRASFTKAYWRLARRVSASQTMPTVLKAPLRPVHRSFVALVSPNSSSSRNLASERSGILGRFRARLRRADLSNAKRGDLVAKFAELFPDREPLTPHDVGSYDGAAGLFFKIFKHYDVIQCYSINPIFALLCGKRPYVGFEHGTLRHFTMDDDPLHRLTALSYRMSDHTFVTNGDCIAYAKRLSIPNHSGALHPINVEQHRRKYGDDVRKIREDIGGDVILFCPTRHDWEIKGTDRFIRALPLIKERVSGRVKLVLADWGEQVRDSKRLVEDLGCAHNVVWKETMCRVSMIKHIQAADVVFDQMVLPAFGSTAPQTLAVGKPVISSHRPEEMAWLFPEPAPILSAYTPEDVANAVETALQSEWRAEFEHRARAWVDTYHHPKNVIRDHLQVYRRLLT